MKIFGALLCIIFLASTASSQTTDAADSSGCPPPKQTFLGPQLPDYCDVAQSLSGDGKSLTMADGGLEEGVVLNLVTLDTELIEINAGFPNEEQLSVYDMVWCPYDPDLLALICSADIDTSANSEPFTVYNLFTYRVSTAESHLITPKVDGPYGSPRWEYFHGFLPLNQITIHF